jgi:hypothetical protein
MSGNATAILLTVITPISILPTSPNLLSYEHRSDFVTLDEYVGHAVQTADLNASYRDRDFDEEPQLGSRPLEDPFPDRTIIEKSNLMLLGMHVYILLPLSGNALKP